MRVLGVRFALNFGEHLADHTLEPCVINGCLCLAVVIDKTAFLVVRWSGAELLEGLPEFVLGFIGAWPDKGDTVVCRIATTIAAFTDFATEDAEVHIVRVGLIRWVDEHAVLSIGGTEQLETALDITRSVICKILVNE